MDSNEQNKREENKFFKNIAFFIKKDIGTTLTLGYLLLIIIGMMFRNNFYSRFNINIFDFADIKDFVLAPFEDPFILLFTLGSIVIFYLLVENRNRHVRNRELENDIFYRYRAIIHRFIPEMVVTFLGLICYIHFGAGIYGKLKYAEVLNTNVNSHITITFDEVNIPKDEAPVLIGISSSYTFIYFKNKKESYAIANDKVKTFKFLTDANK